MAGRILIAIQDRVRRASLSLALEQGCYEVAAVSSSAGIAAGIAKDTPDLLIIDADFADHKVMRHLRSCRDGADTAVILATQALHDEIRVDALRRGLDGALSHPVNIPHLLAKIRCLMRAISLRRKLRSTRIAASVFGCEEPVTAWQPAINVTLVSQQSAALDCWAACLPSAHVKRCRPDDILQAGNGAAQDSGLIVISVEDAQGLPVLSELRSREATRRSSILAIYRNGADDQAALALDLGADDVIANDHIAVELQPRINRLARRKAEVDALRAPVEESLRLATIDPLTNLFNRRYAQHALKQLTIENPGRGNIGAEPTTETVAIMIADLDHFKAVNDRFGHMTGDAVLAEVAARLRDGVRPSDVLARIGGEEFLIIMRDVTSATARAAAKRLCDHVNKSAITTKALHPAPRVSISVGVAVATLTPNPDDIDALYCAADAALYAAKAEGRNCVRLAKIDQTAGGKDAA